jgi:hypothetical protein
MKYSVFGDGFGTLFPVAVCWSIVWMALSVTEVFRAGVVIVAVPVRLPCVMAYFGTSYSASWSTSGLVRMESKNALSWPIRGACAACFQAVPQNNVKTWTDAMSGPLRYVSCAGAAAAASAPGAWSGTMRIAW